MNLAQAMNRIERRTLSLILIILLSVAAGTLLAVSKTEYRVSLSSAVDIWADFVRDADHLGQILIDIKPAQELEIGRIMEQELARTLVFSENLKYQEYVDQVGRSLVDGIQRKEISYRFHVIQSETVNAYAIPGGVVFITTAMLDALDSEAELAAVLGHEISHVDLEHCIDRLKYQLAIRGLLGRDIATLVRLGHELIGLGYREQFELEADSNGMLLAAEAGYEPGAAIDLFRRLVEAHKEEYPQDVQKPVTLFGELAGAVIKAGRGYFATHPGYPSRIAMLETTYRRNQPQWEGRQFKKGTETFQEITMRTTSRLPEVYILPESSVSEATIDMDGCQISSRTIKALNSALETWEKTGRIPEVLALINEAKEASQPPECDNVRARILADKAKRLAENIAASQPIDTTEKTSIESECQISQTAEDALERAWDQKDKNLAIIELLDQAETTAEPPECDSVRAKILADKAYDLIIEFRNQL